jgi:hypothetical protein
MPLSLQIIVLNVLLTFLIFVFVFIMFILKLAGTGICLVFEGIKLRGTWFNARSHLPVISLSKCLINPDDELGQGHYLDVFITITFVSVQF